SYFRFMPEEINRILADHCSDFLFAPTEKAKKILYSEGIKKNVFLTGNTIVDAVVQNLKLAKSSKIIKELNLENKDYAIVTAHRLENVDYKERLLGIIKGLELINKKFGLRIIYPIHPRTKNNIKKFNIKIPKNIELIEPLGYLDFLLLEKNARLVLTDSGGVQEESCVLRVPCVTLRDNTERPETVDVKANILAGVNPYKIYKCAKIMLSRKRDWKNPFGDGKAAERIIRILKKKLEQ
ncbi:MAG: UDP-N-acetylglucosamine 2-epimerase (non-hydrolyzing), partial [Candidatus Woesearchaeota archaeon]